MKLTREHNPFYRWGEKGQTPTVTFERDRDLQASFFGGLSLKTKKEFSHLADSQNTTQFINFLEIIKTKYQKEIEERLTKHLACLANINRGKKEAEEVYEGLILIFLDGASFHKSRQLKEYLKDNYGLFELFRFPTYSPDLNPQEHVWKALRAYLSKVEESYSFRELVDRACLFLRTKTFNYSFV